MSDQQTELNDLTNEFAGLDTGKTVTLMTDDRSIDATVVANRWRSDAAVVTVKSRNTNPHLPTTSLKPDSTWDADTAVGSF